MTGSLAHIDSQLDLATALERLCDLEKVIDTTESLTQTGHYEWSWDEECLKSCSIEYARIFGMTVPQVMDSQSCWDDFLKRIHPDDVEYYSQAVDGMSDTGLIDIRFRIQLEDNTIKHLREVGIVAKDLGKVGKCSFGILQDITEQVKRKRSLVYRDELAQQAEAITDIGHYIFDELSERYTYISEGFARINDSTVEAYMAKVNCLEDDLSDIHPDDRERVQAEYDRYLNTAGECAIEYRVIRSNGQIRWIGELNKARQVKDGKVSQTLGVIQDITVRVNREQALRFNAFIVSEVEEIADIGYFLFDEKMDRNIFISPGQARIVGLDIDTYCEKIVTKSDYIGLVYEEDQALVRESCEQDLNKQPEWKIEYRLLKPNGDLCWILEIGKAFKWGASGVEQSIGLVRDITNQKKIEQELLFKDTLANQAEAITDIGRFVYDELEEQYLFVSPGLGRILGVDEADLVLSSTTAGWDLGRVYEDDREYVKEAYANFFINKDTWQVEYRIVHADGKVRWVKEMGKAFLTNGGIVEQTVGVIQDITEKKNTEKALLQSRDTLEQQVLERTQELSNTVKQLEEQIEERKKVETELEFLANHDALTGLPSLRLCKDRLERLLAAARRSTQIIAVMFLDLDGFKKVNDTLGHEGGDQVLIATAKRIQREMREIDTIARIGGDEFIIIQSDLSKISDVKKIAANIIKKVSQPVLIDQNEVVVSASIGIALYPEDGATSEELMHAADKAMYEVKRSGKNNFGFANTNEPKQLYLTID
ncbi:MAG: diguanylate cyclase (GGDEF)-like protein/PAS domain S-box-containing protein [Polaribacter sp.]|jgi:diguanylate cyclase (GGDEF)-like protein/PAS domain S-box-containing protein